MSESSELLSNAFTTIISVLVAVISYFLKLLHTDIRSNINECNILKAKLELLQQESFGKIDKLASITELQIGQLTANIEKLTRIIDHMNNNMKMRDNAIADILDKNSKK